MEKRYKNCKNLKKVKVLSNHLRHSVHHIIDFVLQICHHSALSVLFLHFNFRAIWSVLNFIFIRMHTLALCINSTSSGVSPYLQILLISSSRINKLFFLICHNSMICSPNFPFFMCILIILLICHNFLICIHILIVSHFVVIVVFINGSACSVRLLGIIVVIQWEITNWMNTIVNCCLLGSHR